MSLELDRNPGDGPDERAPLGGTEGATYVPSRAGSSRPETVGRIVNALSVDVEEYFQREVVPHVPDAWIDHDKTKIGYEIPFNRHFYVFKPPRELDEIDTELKGVTDRIVAMIGELSQ